jgi:hypothetical protein
MFLGILSVATYANPTTGQEAEIRMRQVLDGYRVTASLSPLPGGDDVTTWEETCTTEAEARRVSLRWRTTLALDFGMQQTASTPHGPSATRTRHASWEGKPLRWGTDEA